MKESSTGRRLAAVLAADIAGYSKLMGADEEATVRELKAHQAVVLPMIDEFSGRVIDTAGDGILAEFVSVLNALNCALAIQQVMRTRNAAVQPDRTMLYRIGINTGDIVFDSQRIYGDGVNIAARLEALAEPGGICISGKVYDEVQERTELEFDNRGEQRLKNIARPVRAYFVREPGASIGVAGSLHNLSDQYSGNKPSIAVLPFENRSEDREQQYFVDGLAEDVILMLSKISGLFVIARSSSFSYKDKRVTAMQAAHELAVNYVLEGSVRRSENQVRITIQLIDGASGASVWAERYDRELLDIFQVQDDVTARIVEALSVTLTSTEQGRLSHGRAVDLRAYDCFQRGRELFHRTERDANLNARAVLVKAVDIDPGYAAALAYLALTHMVEHVNNWRDVAADPLQQAHGLALRAVAADAGEPSAHLALAATELWLRHHEIAISECGRAIELDPNYAHAMFILGSSLTYAGRAQEATAIIDKAMQLDPHHAGAFTHWLAMSQFHSGDYLSSANTLRRRLAANPSSDVSRMLLAACLGYLGHHDDARAQWRQVFEINPAFSMSYKRQILPYKNAADFELVVEGLRMAGIDTD